MKNIKKNFRSMFIDKEGNRILDIFIASSGIILLLLLLDFVIRHNKMILNYFSTMHGVIKMFLLLFTMVLSVAKIYYTNYNEKTDKISKISRYFFDGGIILITSGIFFTSFIFNIVELINNNIASMIDNEFWNKDIILPVLSLVLGFYLVAIIYSMGENIFILITALIKKVKNDIKETKEIYSTFIAIIAIIISMIALLK